MNWRGTLNRIKWFFNITGKIRLRERERCISALCDLPAPEVSAATCNGRLDENWVRALISPRYPTV